MQLIFFFQILNLLATPSPILENDIIKMTKELQSSTKSEETIILAHQIMAKRLKKGMQDIKITRHFKDEIDVVHIFAVGMIDNIEIDNHRAKMHIKNGAEVAFSSSFSTKHFDIRQEEVSFALNA